MRKLIALAAVGTVALLAGPVVAADMPDPPPFDPPDVDYDIGGSFYLRGSAALNLAWAKEVRHTPEYEALGGTLIVPVDQLGYGYSWGAGFGYEAGNGLRFDVTIDALENNGLHITKDFGNAVDVDGGYTMSLRSTIALANVYYDYYFGSDAYSGGNSGMFGYVGAGVGAAFNRIDASVNPADPADAGFVIPYGTNVTPAAAVMAGVGVDMGSWTADVGYRGIWMQELSNGPITTPGLQYFVDNPLIHEVRGTIRYRLD